MSIKNQVQFPGNILKLKLVDEGRGRAVLYYDALEPYTTSDQRREIVWGRENIYGTASVPSAFDPYVSTMLPGVVFCKDEVEVGNRKRFFKNQFYICVDGLTENTLKNMHQDIENPEFYYNDPYSPFNFEGDASGWVWLDYGFRSADSSSNGKRGFIGMHIKTNPKYARTGVAESLIETLVKDCAGDYKGLVCQFNGNGHSNRSLPAHKLFEKLEGWIVNDEMAFFYLKD